nr:Bifunctional inhibitor/lipid-transfer protein/seed storage 2S albumin superfamily protein [Ipomoea trifida]
MMSPPPPPPSNTTQVLSVCANLINKVAFALPPHPNGPAARECCHLIQGLVDVCLCVAVKAAVSPIANNVDIQTLLDVVLYFCNNPPNSAIKCPNN